MRTSWLLHRWREAGPLSSLVPGSTLTLNLWTEGGKRRERETEINGNVCVTKCKKSYLKDS